jgi:hypothetical protein
MKEREKKEKAIAKAKDLEEKRLAKEQAKMTKEFEKVDIDTEFDKQVKEKIKKKNIEWSNPK